MLNLPTHREEEEDAEIEEQDRPYHSSVTLFLQCFSDHYTEYRNVKDRYKGHEQRNGCRTGRLVPELEFRKPGKSANGVLNETRDAPSDERLEFLVRTSGQSAPTAFCIVVCNFLFQRRIEFGSEKREEHVEQIDAETISDNVPSLCKDDSDHEEHQQHNSRDPSNGEMWHGLIQV